MRTRLLCIFALLLGVWGCSEETRLLVEVRSGPGVPAPIALLDVRFNLGETLLPQTVTFSLPAPLPQSFEVLPGSITAGQVIQIRVSGFANGAEVAAADAIVQLPTDETDKIVITLMPQCAGLNCAGIQSCDVERASCDYRCLTDVSCEAIVGCGIVTCDGADADKTGTCIGEGVDGDGDGYVDGRCPLVDAAEAELDCDDQSGDVHPGGSPRCGFARDFDCNNIVDEWQLCDSVCDPSATQSLVLEQTDTVELDGNVVSFGARRLTEDGYFLFAGMRNTIATFDQDGTRISEVPTRSLQRISVVGPMLAAATAEGLLLVGIGADGALTRLGPAVQIALARSDQELSTVLLVGNRVYVSSSQSFGALGDTGVTLAVVDITHPDSPRITGTTNGPYARMFVPVPGGVFAATAPTLRDGNLFYIPVDEETGVPGTAVPASEMVFVEEEIPGGTEIQGLADFYNVATIASSPGREELGEGALLAIGTVQYLIDSQDGAKGMRYDVLVVERDADGLYQQRFRKTVGDLVASIHIDRDAILLANGSSVTAWLRGTTLEEPIRESLEIVAAVTWPPVWTGSGTLSAAGETEMIVASEISPTILETVTLHCSDEPPPDAGTL